MTRWSVNGATATTINGRSCDRSTASAPVHAVRAQYLRRTHSHLHIHIVLQHCKYPTHDTDETLRRIVSLASEFIICLLIVFASASLS